MRGIAALILHAAAYNISCDDKALQVTYRKAILDIPGDLFIAAVENVLNDWTDGFRLPSPGIIRAKVQEDIRLRRIELFRLRQQSEVHAEAEVSIPDPAAIAEAHAIVAKMPAGPLRSALERFTEAVEGNRKGEPA